MSYPDQSEVPAWVPDLRRDLMREIEQLRRDVLRQPAQTWHLRWLSVAEVAEQLGVTRDYVRRLLRSGVINGSKPGRCWRISPSNLVAYVESQTPKPHPGDLISLAIARAEAQW